MSTIYAFPNSTPNSYMSCQGMTLREYYTGLAMQAVVAGKEGIHPQDAAKRAREYADDLMAELARTNK